MKSIHGIPARLIAPMVATLLLACTPSLAVPAAQQEQPSQASRVDDAKLEAVAKAYLEVERIEKAYAPRIESARSAEERQKLEQQSMEEMAKAIEDQDGVNVQEYNQVMTAVQTDEQLREQLAAKVHQARQEKENNQKTEE